MYAARRFFVVIFLSAMLASSLGAIHELKVHHDSRYIFDILTFGFDQGGHAQLDVSKFLASGNAGTDTAGFILIKIAAEVDVSRILEAVYASGKCLLTDSNSKTFALVDSGKTSSSFQKDIVIESGGLYTLLYQNCHKNQHDTSFDLKARFYNVGRSGDPDYLPAGDRPLPTLFFVMSCVFAALFISWLVHLRRNKTKIHKIHHLMTILVALKSLSLLFEGVRYHFIRIVGHPTGWSVVFYILNFVRGMLFFTVVLLVGMGWSMVKPFLNDKEKKILLVVLPLQVLVNTAIIVVGEAAPGSIASGTWEDLLHLADLICCLLIMFPIMWSIRQLRTAAAADGKAQQTLDRLTQFRSFYLYTIAYLYFTRIIVYLIGVVLSYKHEWVAPFLAEIAAVIYYVGSGWKFRPTSNNPYVRINTSEEDEEFGLRGDPDASDFSDEEAGNSAATIELAGGVRSSNRNASVKQSGTGESVPDSFASNSHENEYVSQPSSTSASRILRPK